MPPRNLHGRGCTAALYAAAILATYLQDGD